MQIGRSIISLLMLGFLTHVGPAGAANLTPLEYERPPEQTYLTFPEWFLVHSPAEYAHFIKEDAPSDFPFWGHIGQFWDSYGMVYDATKTDYPLNVGYHVMVTVIGVSTTIEYAAKSTYEIVVGRVTELTRTNGMTDEDRFAAYVAQDYVDFLHGAPWYDYDFAGQLVKLWTDTSLLGPDMLRKVERKYALTTEYSVKAVYGWLIGLATAAGYDAPSLETVVVLNADPSHLKATLEKLKFLKRFENGDVLVSVPRYTEFSRYATELSKEGFVFSEIAGNTGSIVVSFIAPLEKDAFKAEHKILMTQPILTVDGRERVTLETPVSSLSALLVEISIAGFVLEHVYDF